MFYIKEYDEKYKDKINEFIISICVEEFEFYECKEELMKEDAASYIKDGGNFWFAVDEQDRVIGTVCIDKIDNKVAWLKRMYVNPEYRGTGLGQQLYNKALDFVKDNCFNRLELGTYERLRAAIKFYLKNGFEEIERIEENAEAKFFALNLI